MTSLEWGYEQAAEALRGALTFGIHPSLDGIRALSEALGRPDDAFASVQITGTNGKSSVARMTAALLEVHGMRSGAFLSPDLGRYTQRFETAGQPVSDDDFARAIAAALEAESIARSVGSLTEPVTEFELLTAAALWLFRELSVDFAVLEVGMGGRWDATSVVRPSVSVITGVGLDHMEHLGSTREAIAKDKSHIIKPASAPVLGPGTIGVEDIFLSRAETQSTHARVVREFGQPTPVAEDMTIRFRVLQHPICPDGHTRIAVRGVHAEYGVLDVAAPAYQAANVATAIAAAEAALGRALNPALVARTFCAITTPGRFEVLASDPWLVVDGAHNPQAAAVLADAIDDAWSDSAARPSVVLGVLADKDAAGIVAALAPVAGRFVCVEPSSPRALSASALAAIVAELTDVPCATGDLAAVVTEQRAAGHDVLVTGSLTTVAEIRQLFLGG
ncbi:MAG: Mur ligase family protein [Coriobacteriia bacterium]|nr:Mur ligase family protein [Coriobacteriia bacterium]